MRGPPAEAQIEALVALFDAASAEAALCGSPALVVDAIDDMDTKAIAITILHNCLAIAALRYATWRRRSETVSDGSTAVYV